MFLYKYHRTIWRICQKMQKEKFCRNMQFITENMLLVQIALLNLGEII